MILLLILATCIAIVLTISITPLKKLDDNIIPAKNPIILLVIDSLMSEPLLHAINEGKAPALSYLIDNGKLIPEVISSYPTMSVTIDSTLLTGTYPNLHKVPGLLWFKKDENRIVSYGSGLREILNNGIRHVAHDSIIHLNQKHLSKEVSTIHEDLAARKIQSASINGLLYRGKVKQQLNVPKLIHMVKLLPEKIEVNGPALFSLGALSQYNIENNKHKYIWKRMGVNDAFTAHELKYLIEQRQLPPFTLAYLPDADASIHKNGPTDLKGIQQVDEAIQAILNSFSSWEDAIKEVRWIVLGDSGQSLIGEDKNTSLIDLNELLKNYSFWDSKHKNAQLALAINERMAYIYLIDSQLKLLDVVNKLKEDNRIAFIAWKDDEKNYVISPLSDKQLVFSPNGKYVDDYEQYWDISGDLSILHIDATDEEGGRIQYKHYPDALARLYGSLHSQEGRVVIVDALPSYEFIEKHSHDHAGGGGHGSLHKVDSVVPLVVTGTDELPRYNRLVDVKNWILQLMSGAS